jgi:bifunctional polynucleotide phosphatase/kinase
VLRTLDIDGVPIYAATSHDGFRKPRVGMWDMLLDDDDLDAEGAVDLANSFFVGDAGGREALGKQHADHSCSDRYVCLVRLHGIATLDRYGLR